MMMEHHSLQHVAATVTNLTVTTTTTTTTSSSTIDPIVRMNNLGCMYIRQGKYDHAARTLSSALTMLRTSIKNFQGNARRQEQDYQDLLADDDDDAVMEEYRYDMFFQRVKLDSGRCNSSTAAAAAAAAAETHLSKVEDTYGYLYKSPIELKDVDICLMEEEGDDGDEHGDDEANKVTRGYDSLVVMFNLALSYHLLAVEMVEHQAYYQHGTVGYATYLKQALSFYDLSNAVMECEQIESGFNFIMCLTNNVGHCHNVLGNQVKATQCFEHLLSIQAYLIDHNRCCCHEGGHGQQVGDEVIDDGFIQNTSRFVVLKNHSAQAA